MTCSATDYTKCKTKGGLNINEWRQLLKLCQAKQVNPKSRVFMDEIVRNASIDDLDVLTEKVRGVIFELDKDNKSQILVEGFNKIALENRIKSIEETLLEIKELLGIEK